MASGKTIQMTIIALILLCFIGCDENKDEKNTKYPNKLYEVSAVLGGAGFDKIADSLGFLSYQPQSVDSLYIHSASRHGGTIKLGIQTFPITLRPYGINSNTQENIIISKLVYETLLDMHPVTNDYIPCIASHWKFLDDSLTFIYRIDPNAKFSNGQPVTAYDILETWRLITDESLLSPALEMTYRIFEIPEVLSPYMIKVKSKNKSWKSFLAFSSFPILSKEEIKNLNGERFLKRYNLILPAGTGKFKVDEKSIQDRNYIRLIRNKEYWGRKRLINNSSAAWDTVVLIPNDNATNAYQQFLKQEIDVYLYSGTSIERWVNDRSSPFINGNVKKIRVLTEGASSSYGFAFNLRKPPFDDSRVRQAFALLYNKELVIRRLLFNEYQPINSYYSNTAFRNPNNQDYSYNPSKALRLLQEAGWKKQGNVLVKNGSPLTVDMAITRQLEVYVLPYKEELKKAGITLNLRYVDKNVLSKINADHDFSITWFNYIGSNIPNPESMLTSSLADRKNTRNIWGYKNPAVDSLCNRCDAAFNMQERVEIIRKIDSISVADCISILMWEPKGIRISYWDKFTMPDYSLNRFAVANDAIFSIINLWKPAGRKEGDIKPVYGKAQTGIKVIDFWKKRNKL